MSRAIVHLDADAFFASVEQAADPRLRGRPIAVGGEKRGIIASASYEARKLGVYTPMPTALARRLCPRLVILPGDFEKYELFSRLMFSYAYDFTPDVEVGSIDEGYFDLTGARHPALGIAETIRRAIRQALKLSVSEGLASNKLVSQIASKLKKPSAFEVVPEGTEASFLAPLANKWLPGIGPKTATQLNAAGLARIGQIAHTPPELLGLLVGSLAPQLRGFARGIDERPVITARAPAKSYSEQETFEADTTDEAFIDATLRRMADKLMAKVRADAKSIRTVTVKVRYNDMDEQQAGESLPEPTDVEAEIYSKVSALLRKAWQRRVSLRLVSLKLSNVYDSLFRGMLPLDVDARRHDSRQRLAGVIDELRDKFGRSAVLHGHDFVLREVNFGRTPLSANRSRGENSPKRDPAHCTPEHRERAPHPGPLPEGEGESPAVLQHRQVHGVPKAGEGRVPFASWSTVGSGGRGTHRFGSASEDEIESGGSPPFPQPRHSKTLRCFERLPKTGHSLQVSNSKFQICSSQFSILPCPQPLPLNIHSYYSFLDSTLSIDAIVQLAKRHDLPAIALTDKNNLHGAIEFSQAATRAGIKPIIGAELEFQGRRCCVYVENQTGYRNLCRILTEMANAPLTLALSRGERENPLPSIRETETAVFTSNSEISSRRPLLSPLPLRGGEGQGEGGVQSSFLPGFMEKKADPVNQQPRAVPYPAPAGGGGSTPTLFEETEGLIAVSGDTDLARFFPGRFYFAVNNPEMAGKRPASLPAVLSLSVHYPTPADRWKYDVVQSIRTLTLLRQQHPEKRLDGAYHFRPPAEIRRLFERHADLLARTREIAERCSFAFPPANAKPQFPNFAPPDGSSPAAFLRRLALEGLQRRYPSNHARLRPQIEQELEIIFDVGYEEYFLVMWDILQECRRRGIEWITRGSAADSLVCYCLEISGVCPIRFDLYFRRFLNQDRMALNKLPDIDVDFPHDRKDDVIDLIFGKYGRSHTAVVGGFSTFQSRSAFAEVAKVLGVSDHQARRITERLPHFSRPSELAETASTTLECRDLPLEEEPYRDALQMAHFLDGFPRYAKMHPCGVVLSRQPMNEITPCFLSAKGYPTTHFDMDSVETAGLVKMDILAQGGLAVMRDVRQMLEKQGLSVPDLNDRDTLKGGHQTEPFSVHPLGCQSPWDDPQVWELIAGGDARAVHHIESPAMISLCKMCNARDIDTLIAIVSVIRPGAANESKKMEFARRYQGLSPVRYPHPSLAACLRSTYGLVVYEEHILQICEAFAGLPPGRADVLRRALGKDKTDVIDQIQIEFADCARRLGRSEAEIADVWALVAGFRGYAFCKAHSTAYGVEAYQAAWLKRYYPAEFMAAVLTNGKGFYQPLVYILECHRLGIPLLPPSVNEPGPGFTMVHQQECPRSDLGTRGSSSLRSSIRVPVTQVKGLTRRTSETILRERERGPFLSLTDFLLRVQPLPEEMEALIRVGAFDEFGHSRTRQYWEFKSTHSLAPRPPPTTNRQTGGGPTNLKSEICDSQFLVSPSQSWLLPPGNLDRLPSVPLSEPDHLQRLRWEEELLSYPVSGHPLDLYPDIAWNTYCPIHRLEQHVGREIVTCGLVIEQRLFHQVTGEPMKFLTIADKSGIIETELFARTYQSYGLNTIRYRVLEIAATVEPFENGRGHTLRVLRAGKPRHGR